ncbi:MAG: SDR family NAD(P)-dependent oxidoreductase [Pelagibacterales bacterium]|nr:SDR family NAD(P)-dependent oxidoreductase [Pelagibacterales bacterium]
MQNPQNIVITGASSGIGKALAIAYSKQAVNLFLGARNLDKLQEVKQICQELNSQINVFCSKIDVKDEQKMLNWISEIEQKFQIDLVIANAGISAGTASGTESSQQIKEIFAVNVDGVLNTINPTILKMKERKKGQIAIISSLAGFRGLPSSPAYSASKAAVRVYGEALRGNLASFGIEVSVICPGYIKTPMTDVNEFPMPFLMKPEICAKKIINGLRKNKSRISFPFPLFFTVWFCTLLTNRITDPIFAKLPAKKSL